MNSWRTSCKRASRKAILLFIRVADVLFVDLTGIYVLRYKYTRKNDIIWSNWYEITYRGWKLRCKEYAINESNESGEGDKAWLFLNILAYEELGERQDEKPTVWAPKHRPRSYPRMRGMVPPSLISLVPTEHSFHGFCRIIPSTDLSMFDRLPRWESTCRDLIRARRPTEEKNSLDLWALREFHETRSGLCD